MSRPYLDGEQIREAEQALRDGVTVERVAAHFRVTPDELNQLLGRPQWKSIPSGKMTVHDGVDLWAFDATDDVL